MSWQKIAEEAFLMLRRSFGPLVPCKCGPASISEELTEEDQKIFENIVRQAVCSYQMGMLQKDPELMVVLTPEMKQ